MLCKCLHFSENNMSSNLLKVFQFFPPKACHQQSGFVGKMKCRMPETCWKGHLSSPGFYTVRNKSRTSAVTATMSISSQ